MRRVDLSGQRFGKLVAVEATSKKSMSGRSRVYWLCHCDCGRTANVAAINLRNGMTRSCGCRRVDVCVERIRHGDCRNGTVTSEYRAWAAMMARCYRDGSKDYKNWGGRGIVVCKRWHDSANFVADMGRKPTPEHSLDRINNNGNYEPGNCRWATRSVQNSNRRPFGSGSI